MGVVVRGSIALVDALGFKGIWKRVPADQIVTKLAKLMNTVKAIKNDGMRRA